MWNFIRRRWYLILAALVLLLAIPTAILLPAACAWSEHAATHLEPRSSMTATEDIERLGQQGDS